MRGCVRAAAQPEPPDRPTLHVPRMRGSTCSCHRAAGCVLAVPYMRIPQRTHCLPPLYLTGCFALKCPACILPGSCLCLVLCAEGKAMTSKVEFSGKREFKPMEGEDPPCSSSTRQPGASGRRGRHTWTEAPGPGHAFAAHWAWPHAAGSLLQRRRQPAAPGPARGCQRLAPPHALPPPPSSCPHRARHEAAARRQSSASPALAPALTCLVLRCPSPYRHGRLCGCD